MLSHRTFNLYIEAIHSELEVYQICKRYSVHSRHRNETVVIKSEQKGLNPQIQEDIMHGCWQKEELTCKLHTGDTQIKRNTI